MFYKFLRFKYLEFDACMLVRTVVLENLFAINKVFIRRNLQVKELLLFLHVFPVLIFWSGQQRCAHEAAYIMMTLLDLRKLKIILTIINLEWSASFVEGHPRNHRKPKD